MAKKYKNTKGYFSRSHIRIYEKGPDGKKYSRPATYKEEMTIKYGVFGTIFVYIKAILTATLLSTFVIYFYDLPLWICLLVIPFAFFTTWFNG